MTGHPLGTGCPFFVLVVDKGRSAIAIDHGHNAHFQSSVPEEVWKMPYEAGNFSVELGESQAGGVPDILPTFARCILNDEVPPATAVDGARTSRFILKCFESARTGKLMQL